MRATVSGLWIGLAFTSMASSCAPGTGPREDALWRAYRESGAPREAPAEDARLFETDAPLDRAKLIGAVLARNPSVAAAREGLRGALAEVEQARGLDDPKIGYEVAPLSIAGDAPVGQAISVRQKLPFPGKRRLAGEVALARAEVDAADLEAVRLELAQLASELYDDYYVAARALEINAHHDQLLAEIKKSAEAQYVAGRAAQQDPIQAEVELAQLARERITLEAERDQIAAQLNGLLHRAPGAQLPPAPASLTLVIAPAGTSAELQELALRRTPRREAARARIRAGRTKTAAAQRDFYPDVELMSSYNTMWDMPEHRWMVGLMIDVPIQRGKRHAAVAQAEAQTARARFEDERLADQIRVDVDRAYRKVTEAESLLSVLTDKLLPAARAQVDSARAGFTAAKNSFLAVVEAQNNLREVELSLEMTRAELSRRRAALAREVGVAPGGAR